MHMRFVSTAVNDVLQRAYLNSKWRLVRQMNPLFWEYELAQFDCLLL